MTKEDFGASIVKKFFHLGVTCCIACAEKGSTECKWIRIRENESNKYKWVQRSKEESEFLFPTCGKNHYMEDLIKV